MKRYVIFAAVGLVLFAGGIAVGRSGRPAEVKTQMASASTAASTTTARTDERVTQAPTRIVTKRILVPCPPAPNVPPAASVTEETTTDIGPSTTESTTTSETASASTAASSSSTVTRDQPRLMVGAKAGLAIRDVLHADPTVIYGADVRYRMVGPLWLGVEANSRGEGYVSLSVTF